MELSALGLTFTHHTPLTSITAECSPSFWPPRLHLTVKSHPKENRHYCLQHGHVGFLLSVLLKSVISLIPLGKTEI